MTAKDQTSTPFWRAKTLDEMSASEWESLCDGCGRCCLVKLEDEDSGKIHFTDIGCKLLDAKTCRCLDYGRRHRRVPDCVKLTPAAVRELSWLPVDLRLSACRRRTGSLRLASARFGFAGQRARGRRLRARPGLRQRERPCARILAAPDRQMAEPPAARPRAQTCDRRSTAARGSLARGAAPASGAAEVRSASRRRRRRDGAALGL